MSDFRTATTPLQRIDPSKRVKYSLGLVLGVDEFEQEQAFFLERGRLHTRALHGYGTAHGLRVSADGHKVMVEPGLALDPLGREVRVCQAQCANLNEWLAVPSNRPAGKPPSNLDLYVVLSYRECETDSVPVPGAPCRSEAETLTPSRITETFDLKFTLTPPNQQEEEAVRLFGDLLNRIEVTAEYPDNLVTVAQMENEVRDLRGAIPSSPPAGPLRVHPEQIEAVLRAVFRVWVTEVKPKFRAQQLTTATGGPVEQAVLLARLACTLNDAWEVHSVTVDEENRPYLLTTRLLQEYLLQREQPRDHGRLKGLYDDDHRQYLPVNAKTRALIRDLNAANHRVTQLAEARENGDAVRYEQAIKVGDQGQGDLAGTYPNVVVDGLQGRPIDPRAPEEGAVLVWTGKVWRPTTHGIGVKEHGLLSGLEDDDHPQYFRVDGSRPLAGDLNADGHRIINLPASASDGEPIVRGQEAAGDLSGIYPAPTVSGLQGQQVSADVPPAGAVLTWTGEEWRGRRLNVAQAVSVELPTSPFVTITRVPPLISKPESISFQLWFHLDVGDPRQANLPELQAGFEMSVFQEWEDDAGGDTPYLTQIPLSWAPYRDPERRNVFYVDFAEAPRLGRLRFIFLLSSMALADGPNLDEWVAKRPVKYLGHDGVRTVTAFWAPASGADLSRPRQVAAGSVDLEGQVRFGNIICKLRSEGKENETIYYYLIAFPGYDPKRRYVVTGTPIARANREPAPPVVVYAIDDPESADQGLRVELRRVDGLSIPHPFMVVVTEVPEIRVPENW